MLRWKKLYSKAFKGESFKQETYTSGMGSISHSWFEVYLNPIFDKNEVIGAACYGRNITEKKDAVLKLKESHLHLKKLTKTLIP